MAKLSVRDLEVKGRRVLMRVDFNVPTEEIDGKIRITDDTRIRESLPTIELLREKGAKVILLAHFGRPKGKPNPKYSLRPVADHLTQMIPPPVSFSPEVIGPEAEAASKALPDGGVLLVENVRFFKEEEANEEGFAKGAREIGRCLRQRCFRGGSSGACQHGRGCQVFAAGGDGSVDGARAAVPA